MPVHKHNPASGGSHTHTIPQGNSTGTTGVKLATTPQGNGLDLGDESDPIVSGSGFTGNTGSNQAHDNIPPFFEVAYIIKL